MRYLLLLFSIILTSHAFAQIPDTLYLYTEQFEVRSQEYVEIPIKVDEYVKIEAFQFSVNWNPHQLQFDTVSAINPASGIKIKDIGLARTDKGLLVLSFIDPINGGVTLPDSSTLFTLRYKAVSVPSVKVIFNISDYDREVDAYGLGVFRTVIHSKTVNKVGLPSDLNLYSTACSVTYPTIPDGEITFRAFGGTYPMTLFFKPIEQQVPELYVISNGQTIKFDSLSTGSYVVRIIDSDNQEVRDTISLTDVAPWAVELLVEDPTCSNVSDGSAYLASVSGYEEPYVYTWSTFDILSPVLDSIDNGSYYVKIQDRQGCTYEELFSLNTAAPVVDIQVGPTACASVNYGSVRMEVLEGNPFADTTYQFILDEGEIIREKIFTADSLAAGFHHLTLIDSTECTYTYEFKVALKHAMYITDTTTLNIGCDNNPGGFIVVVQDTGTIAGEIVPTLVPEIGTVTQVDSLITISNLPKGKYTLYLNFKNAPNACGDSIKFTVIAPPSIRIKLENIKHEICAGEDNGAIAVSVSGGLGSFYNYAWSDGGDSSSRNNLAPGEYCLTVTDDSGCHTDTCFTISEGTGFTFILDSVKNLRCPGIPQGSITFHIRHDSGPVSDTLFYTITPQVNYEILHDSLLVLDSLLAGSYQIEIRNEEACAIDTIINVGEPLAPSITVDSIGDAGCFNQPIGYIALSASLPGDSTTSVKWRWSSGDTTAYINNLTAGYYYVSITNSNNCIYEKRYFIDSLGGPLVDNVLLTEPSCYGGNDGSITLKGIHSPVGIVGLSWNTGDTSPSIDSLSIGYYSYEVTDSSGCILRDSVYLTQPDSLQVSIKTTAETGSHLGSATATITGGTEPYDITWSSDPPIKGDTSVELSAGNYSLVVIDKNKCYAIASFTIDNRTSLNNPNNSELHIYPNPANQKIFITNNPSLNASAICFTCMDFHLNLVNSIGHTIKVPFNVTDKVITLYTTGLTPGIYTIILTYNGKITYNKVLIQR